MTRLLLDMGLPRRTAEDLRARGLEVDHVSVRGLSTATDESIVALAIQERRVIVTEDHDFARILARTGEKSPSLIFMRIPRLGRDQATAMLVKVIEAARADLEFGAIVTVSPKGTRVHRLPLR